MNRKHSRAVIASLLGLAALSLFACSKGKKPDVAATPAPPADASFACSLLTPEEVQAVQGDPFKSTKPSRGTGPGLEVSQCYFELPIPVNSIVLTVTRKAAGTNSRDPTESWRDIFYREHPREKESEEGEGKVKGPQKIEGVGDEAFWTGSRIGGALFVLKGNAYLRISVGGAGDQAQKIEKCKALAAFALKRL